MKRIYLQCIILALTLPFCGCRTHPPTTALPTRSHFTGLTDFSRFACTTNAAGEIVLISPVIPSPLPWREAIVSWNALAPTGSYVVIEAAAITPKHQTSFYTMARWAPVDGAFPRTSLKGQADADGTVDTDTLLQKQPGTGAILRVTLGGQPGQLPTLKFLGIDFADPQAPPVSRPPNQAAWGKIIPTPEHSQHGYPNAKGWCSPTSLSMVLSRWADVLHRPEMDLTVPQTAAAVYDASFAGTGNWPFNTAFAGSYPGLRAYVTRLDDLREVEDWIAAGIPVILSARWDWLADGRPPDNDGHLIVCIGFTADGDVVINDPATRLDRGESVRHIYKRANVIHSWTKSHNAVYLVYPEAAALPPDQCGHWYAPRVKFAP